jgi:intracellular sulfur oxidation DsrE/DsrF family protein
MSRSNDALLARRGFLGRLSAAAAGAATVLALPPRLGAAPGPPRAAPSPADPDAWIARVTGTDRMLLHAHQRLQPALDAANGLLRDARDGYGVPERENGIAVATHGPAIGGMFRDELWREFTLGEHYKLTDPATGAPPTANPFLRAHEDVPAEATVPALMRRGVVFLVCNVAVRNLSRRVARAGASAEATHRELVAGLLPDVVVVPNVFVAISHAQKAGIGYLFID